MHISKKILLLLLLDLGHPLELCASNTGLFSKIKNLFSSFTIFAAFKRPPLNKRWIGIGALVITSGIVAWKYFNSKPKNSLIDQRDVFNKLGESRVTWTDIKDAEIVYSQKNKNQEIEIEKPSNVTNEDNFTQKHPDEIGLDSILNEADNEILTQEILNKFSINDVVRVTDSTDYDYINRIGIIRKIDLESADIEILPASEGRNTSNFTTLLTIEKQKLQKLKAVPLLEGEDVPNQALILFEIKQEEAKDRIVNTMVKTVKDSSFIWESLDKPLIGRKIWPIPLRGNYQVQTFFLRSPDNEILPPQTLVLDPNKKNLKIIKDPDTNTPIIMK